MRRAGSAHSGSLQRPRHTRGAAMRRSAWPQGEPAPRSRALHGNLKTLVGDWAQVAELKTTLSTTTPHKPERHMLFIAHLSAILQGDDDMHW